MQTRFTFKEGLMTALGIKNQTVKLSLMLVSGALVWANNGLIEGAKAQSGYWEQAQKQQEEQQRQQQWLNDQEMLRQQNEEYYRQQQEAEARRQQERAEYNRQHPHGEPYVPAPKQKPSSYGAVAWDLKKGYVGTASQQASKQVAIDKAMQRCGTANCKIQTWYANQCVAGGAGDTLSKQGIYWYTELDLTREKVEQKLLETCSKTAKNCKVFLSECSLAGEVGGDDAAYADKIRAMTRYGAIAWGSAPNAYGIASGQKSEQSAADLAIKQCGASDCVLAIKYENQCAVLSRGVKADGSDHVQVSSRATQKQAETEGLAGCAKHAKHCKILLSECSLP